MARIAGYLSFKGGKDVEGLLERMSKSFNLPNPGLASVMISADDGAPAFGVTLVEEGTDSDELERRIIRHGKKLDIIDGRIDGFSQQEVSQIPKSTLPHYLAEQWGKDPANFHASLRGGVAGLSFDSKHMNLSLFRDRFGARTFYYYFEEGLFLFSSEIKALLQYQSFPVNKNMLCRYLSMNYRMWFGRSETFFKDIYELPIASYIDVTDRGIQINRYWAPPDSVLPDLVDDEFYISLFQKYLNTSVYRALQQSNKRLFLVSGGLDAPVIAAKASELLGERVDCCAAVFPENKDYDESYYIRVLTDKIGNNVYLHQPEPKEFLQTFQKILQRHDQPLISPTYVLFYQLSEIAGNNGYDSVFGGVGGDIVSQGCLEYQPYLLADYYQMGKDIFETEVSAWCNRVGPYLRYWPGKPDRLKAKIAEMVDFNQRGVIRHNPDWVRVDRSVFGKELLDTEVRAPYIGFQYNTYRQSRLAEEIFHQNIAGHFAEDINSASFRIAGFDPFWDLDLVELGFTMPLRMFLRDGWTKYIMRQAVAGILPDELRWRPDKTGLGIPINDWLRTEPLAGAFKVTMRSSSFLDSNLLNVEYIKDAYENHISGKEDNGDLLWKVFAFCNWAEHWLQPK